MTPQQKDLALLSHQLQRKVRFLFKLTIIETVPYEFCFIFSRFYQAPPNCMLSTDEDNPCSATVDWKSHSAFHIWDFPKMYRIKQTIRRSFILLFGYGRIGQRDQQIPYLQTQIKETDKGI